MPAITVQMKQTSATVTEGKVRSHVVNIDRPEAKGGTDTGAMGGELLLMSLGGCFMSNLLEAVRTREAAVSEIKIDVVGNLEGTPSRFTAIEMQISAVHDDTALLEKLVTISERSCIVANSIKDAIDLKFTIMD